LGGRDVALFFGRGKEKIKNNFGEGYAFLNHGGVESPGIKKSHFLNFISRNFCTI